MPQLDKQFALVRDGKHWYPARIAKRGSRAGMFRISERCKSRDAGGQAECLDDIETVARRVLMERRRMRCVPEGAATTNSLDLDSKGVTGYQLDPAIAARLGLPAMR